MRERECVCVCVCAFIHLSSGQTEQSPIEQVSK